MQQDYTVLKSPILEDRESYENVINKVVPHSTPNTSGHVWHVQVADDRLRAGGGTLNITWDGSQALPNDDLAYKITLGSVLAVLDLFTILGNALVCVTVATIARLRTTTNFFIFSLALSDLLLGCLVLPFSVLNTLFPEHWPLGAVFCNLYVSTDVMLCTVSILNLFLISIDRYFAITRPLRYELEVTGRKVLVVIVGVWVFSALLAFVPIHLGWNTQDGSVQNWDLPTLCLFEGNAYYVLLVSIGTYFIPLIIMCTVYSKVYAVATKQSKAIRQMTVGIKHEQYTSDSDVQHVVENGGTGGISKSANKAIFTLASVIAAFVICWVPYFVMFTARPFVTGGFNPHVDLLALWLGYANSALNPFLYTFLNKEFRYGFFWVLCPQTARKYKQRHPDACFV